MNGTPELDKCIKAVFAPVNFIGNYDALDKHISSFNEFLAFDDWKVVRTGKEISFTKADKIGKTKVASHIAAYKKQMLANNWAEMPQYFITSSLEATGRDTILEYIDQINEDIFKNESF